MFGLTATHLPTRSPFMHTHKPLISALLLALAGLLAPAPALAAGLATAPVTAQGGAGDAVSLNAVVEAVRQTTLSAQVPGAIVALRVKVGDKVKAGQPLAVMEAMKMEHTISAPKDGTVAELLYAPGDQVADGAELLKLG